MLSDLSSETVKLKRKKENEMIKKKCITTMLRLTNKSKDVKGRNLIFKTKCKSTNFKSACSELSR